MRHRNRKIRKTVESQLLSLQSEDFSDDSEDVDNSLNEAEIACEPD